MYIQRQLTEARNVYMFTMSTLVSNDGSHWLEIAQIAYNNI